MAYNVIDACPSEQRDGRRLDKICFPSQKTTHTFFSLSQAPVTGRCWLPRHSRDGSPAARLSTLAGTIGFQEGSGGHRSMEAFEKLKKMAMVHGRCRMRAYHGGSALRVEIPSIGAVGHLSGVDHGYLPRNSVRFSNFITMRRLNTL
jgi:hypothetical protein